MNEEKKPDLMKMPESEEGKKKTKTMDRTQLRKRMLFIMGIIVGILIIILVVLIIIQLVSHQTLSYEELETKMKNAAISYYKVQKDLLPKEENETVTVEASTLHASEYMKSLDEYLPKGISCKGEVTVQKVNNRYVYTPYLDCGKDYQTKELYKAVIDQGVVTSGYGLYQIGEEYVYRGEEVNNYVTFADTTWRIVKITSNQQVLMALADEKLMPIMEWDNRYNTQETSKTGINTYHVSRVKEALDLYTKEATDDTVTFKEADLDKMATFPLCVGARNEDQAVNDNSQECALLEENQVIGLLTVSDYLNASADGNCHATLDRACQNYNYLKLSQSFWLATPDSKNTKDVYHVNYAGYVKATEASDSHHVRPVVQLSHTVMIQSGNGTEEKPFLLK